jgi:hypothetical protein
MRIRHLRHLKGQTRFGIFQNLLCPGDCGGIKYIDIHFGEHRFEIHWASPFWDDSDYGMNPRGDA